MGAMGQYAFEDKLNVYEQMAAMAGRDLRDGKVVVVDATFYREEMRIIFKTLAKLLHKPSYYFEIIADEARIRKRLSQPRADSEADYAVYRQIKLHYEPTTEPHLVLESTDDNVDQMIATALTHIDGMNERKTD